MASITTCMSLQWPIRFRTFNSIKKVQMSFVIIFLIFIKFYIILKYMCINSLQCWWEWILDGVQQYINICWSNCGLRKEAFTNFEWMCTKKSITKSYGWSTLKSIYSQTTIAFCLKIFANQVPKVWKIYIDLLIFENKEEISLCSTTLLSTL
jgi:hypothetical protein